MAEFDLSSAIKSVVGLIPVSSTTNATLTGPAVDTLGYESVTCILAIGAIASGSVSFTLTECATVGGTYTAVAADDIIGGTAGASAVLSATTTTAQLGYRGKKQFIKMVMAGTYTTTLSAGTVILSNPKRMPVA